MCEVLGAILILYHHHLNEQSQFKKKKQTSLKVRFRHLLSAVTAAFGVEPTS